ncbi:hypothetical protein [uncultured Dysgonomonas sp.]|uniref:hypothetical protein n=1 Tax=uncultured Dysgonomonas sp. TaxID=206096 RepID=UPI00261DDC9D|nr:hypothetical protein [uncultured Dysgonomonas sp.]
MLALCLTTFSCIKDHVIPPDNSQTERLLFRSWEMVAEENGIDSLKNVKRSFVTFSSDGTWSSSVGSYAPIGSGDDRYWKWHPTVPNRLLWWYLGHETNENNYIDLRVVTEDSLKIIHSNVYFKGKYTFVPFK